MAAPNVTACWAQIEKWLAANAPDALKLLPGPAAPAAIAEAEEQLGFALPADVAEGLAVHDGSGVLWLHDRGAFMSVARMVKQWDTLVDLWDDGDNDEWAEPEGPIKKRWFARGWLPVLETWGGDFTCVDLDPPEGGTRGQAFDWSHTNGPTTVLAPSYAALLRTFVEELDAGYYAAKLNAKGQPYLEYSGPGA